MSALLHINDVSFSRGSDTLFDHLSLSIRIGDRIGLVGHNGSGKSTLMSLIVGQLQPNQGEIQMPRGQRVALVEQFIPKRLKQLTLTQALLDVLPKDSQADERYRVDTLLQQLQFPTNQWSLSLSTLSGGEQNLAMLARALLAEPDLLLMDEPGNHMDVVALGHLRDFLTTHYRQPFMMISHDRELLDTCCTRTVFLRDKRIHAFDMPYELARSALLEHDEQTNRRRHAEEKEIKRLQASSKRLATWGKVYDNEDLARKAKSMQKRVDRLKDEQTIVSKGSGLELKLQAEEIRARSVVTLEQLEVSTTDMQRQLLTCEFHRIKPGDRVVLLGENGIGKSTMLNRLLAAFSVADDSVRFNPNASLGFYDQELRQFSSEDGRFDWLRDRCDGPDERIKQVLLQAGVGYQDFGRAVNTLSGGECARLMFMMFRLNQPNFMILDEPTNHIDIDGREQLEQQLIESSATLLFTSHDRRFIERVASRYWRIHNRVLEELFDLDEFYAADFPGQFDQLNTATTAEKETGNLESAERQCDEKSKVHRASEDVLLQRIESLEALLAADKARKGKFQKPDKQRQWETEIQQLWDSIN